MTIAVDWGVKYKNKLQTKHMRSVPPSLFADSNYWICSLSFRDYGSRCIVDEIRFWRAYADSLEPLLHAYPDNANGTIPDNVQNYQIAGFVNFYVPKLKSKVEYQVHVVTADSLFKAIKCLIAHYSATLVQESLEMFKI